MGPAAARRRRAAAECRRDPGAAPADPGQLVLQPRRRSGPGDQGRAPACSPTTWSMPEPAARRSGLPGGAELNPFEADVRDRLAACGITSSRSTASAATGSTSPPRTPRTPTGWCWRSRPTAPPTASPAASATGTGCAASTCSGSAGVSPALVHELVPDPQAEVAKLRDAYDRRRSGPTPRPRHPRRLCPTTRHWPTNPYLPTTRRRPPTSWHPRPTLFPTAPRWLRAPQRPRQLVRQASPTRGVSPGRHGSPVLDPRRAPIALPAGDPASARGLPAANG